MDFIDNMKHMVKGQRKRRETLATLPGLSRKKADIIEELDERDEDNIAEGLVGFVALRPKSTSMVIAGRSVHLTTLIPGQT